VPADLGQGDVAAGAERDDIEAEVQPGVEGSRDRQDGVAAARNKQKVHKASMRSKQDFDTVVARPVALLLVSLAPPLLVNRFCSLPLRLAVLLARVARHRLIFPLARGLAFHPQTVSLGLRPILLASLLQLHMHL
jgi:hypothetical protein